MPRTWIVKKLFHVQRTSKNI